MENSPPANPPRTISRRRRRVFRLLILLIVLLMIELGSFLVVRMIAKEGHPQRSETHLLDAHRNHRLNPDYRHSGKRLHASDGFRRDKPLALAKPDKTIRIVVLGTSAIYGIGSSAPYPVKPPLGNDQTVPYQLQQLLMQSLSKSHPGWNVEVINGGISAYKTFHHLVHLNSRLLAYRPDIVINIDGHNDFYFSRQLDRWHEYAYSTSILVDEYNGRTFFLPFFTFNRSMARYSNFFNLLERVSRRVWLTRVEKPLRHTPAQDFPGFTEGVPLVDRVREVARSQYLRDLWQIHQLGQLEGYDHMVFLQPEVVFESDQRLIDSDVQIKQITVKHLSEGHNGRMERIRKLLPQLFAELKVPFHDVSELTRGGPAREALYVDYCHLSPAGAMRLAKAIEAILLPTVIKRIAAAR